MKKLFFAIIFLGVYTANAQVDTIIPYKNSLRYDMVPALNSTFSIGFEQYVTPVSSLLLIPAVMYKENNENVKQGFLFEAQYRYHVINRTSNNGKSIISYYVAPYASAKFFRIEDSYSYSVYDGINYDYITVDYTDEFSAFSGGIIGGTEVTFAKKLFLDMYIGGGIRTSDSDQNNESVIDPGFKGIAPRIGVSIGVRF